MLESTAAIRGACWSVCGKSGARVRWKWGGFGLSPGLGCSGLLPVFSGA